MQTDETVDEKGTIPLLPETEETRRQLDELEREVMGKKVDEMEDSELVDAVEAINDETLKFLEKEKGSKDAETAKRAALQHEAYGKVLLHLEKVEALIVEGNSEQAESDTLHFLVELAEEWEGRGMEEAAIQNAVKEIKDFVNLYEAMVEATELEGNAKMQMLSTGLDLLPFIGGAKMAGEALKGKTLAGQTLKGKQRLLHGAEGALWMTVDTAAVATGLVSGGSGSAIVEAGELALKAPKAGELLKRSGALWRASRGAGKGSTELFRVGKYLMENPKVGEKIDKLVARGVEARKAAYAKAPEHLGEALDARTNRQEVMEQVNTERKELLDALGNLAA